MIPLITISKYFLNFMIATFHTLSHLQAIFLDTNGNVLTCGYNRYEKLGLGDQHTNIPEKNKSLGKLLKEIQSILKVFFIHFYLIVKDQCGCVDTMLWEGLDWETQGYIPEKSKSFRNHFHLGVQHSPLFLDKGKCKNQNNSGK